MLRLISPPDYGERTWMEYLANHLGIAFMQINGPALGHEVTSLDPEDAPHLRSSGKKVCVVMAGNLHTESGGKSQISEMLANRADAYNLGSHRRRTNFVPDCLAHPPGGREKGAAASRASCSIAQSQ